MQSNPKSNSEQYNPQEDGGSGFPIESSRGPKQNGFFSGQLNSKMTSKQSFDSYKPQGAVAAQLSMFSVSVASHGSSRFDIISRETSDHPQWPGPRYNNRSDVDSLHLLDRPNSSYKKDGHQPGKDSTMVKKLFQLFFKCFFSSFCLLETDILTKDDKSKYVHDRWVQFLICRICKKDKITIYYARKC